MALTQEDKDKLKELVDKGKDGLTGAEFKEYLGLIADKTELEIESMNANGELDRINQMLQDSPRFKNYARRQEVARGIEGGIEALKTISNMSVARRQIDEAKRLENELIDPAAPPTSPKSQALADATETARRDLSLPLRDIDPILQANIQNLRGNLGAAQTASTGQAGVYGSLAQSAYNQATRNNNALIPQIESIRRQQQAEYNRLISAGISEDDMRFKQSMDKYRVAENRYLMEAQAIGGLRAAGEQNMFNTQNQLFDQIGSGVNQAVNFNYGGIGAKEVNNVSSPSYNVVANNPYQTGVMTNNIAQATARPQYSAIGNFGQKYQDYATTLRQNLEGVISPYLKKY